MRANSESLRDAPRYLRSKPATGGQPQVERKGGYRQQGVIRSASIVSRGEALGHDEWLDQSFIESVAEAINQPNKGVKSRFTHPSLSGDGLGTFLGRVMDAEVVGGRVLADIHFTQASHNTPDGDLATYVMDLAEEDPESFGVSIVYQPDLGAEDEFNGANEDEFGVFQSPDEDNARNLPHARLANLRAGDVVDEPAANPGGLFHREQEFAQEADAVAEFALGLSDKQPNLVALSSVNPDRMRGFVSRFLNTRGMEIRKMAEDTKPAEEPTPAPQEEPKAAEEQPKPEPKIDPQTGNPVISQQSAVEQSERFTEAFGDKGAVWFCEGKTFEQAYALHAESQAKELADAKAEVEKLKQQLSGAQPAGEGEPADFGSGEPTERNRKGFASRIRMPAPSAN